MLSWLPAKYAKFITGIVGSAATVASTYYGSQHWFVMVMAALTALGIYAVPNGSTSTTATTTTAAAPADTNVAQITKTG